MEEMRQILSFQNLKKIASRSDAGQNFLQTPPNPLPQQTGELYKPIKANPSCMTTNCVEGKKCITTMIVP